MDYLEEKQYDIGVDELGDDFGLDESEDEEEFDGLAAYMGDHTVSL